MLFLININFYVIIIIKSEEWRMPCDIKNVDIDVEVVEGAIQSDYWCVTVPYF